MTTPSRSFAIAILVLVGCGGSGGGESPSERFSGTWRGALIPVDSAETSSPECSPAEPSNEIHTVTLHPLDSDGNSVSLNEKIVGFEDGHGAELEGKELSEDSFDVWTGSASTIGVYEQHIIYEDVSDGRANVTMTWNSGGRAIACYRTWKGTFLRDGTGTE